MPFNNEIKLQVSALEIHTMIIKAHGFNNQFHNFIRNHSSYEINYRYNAVNSSK